MKTNVYSQIEIVESESASEFQELFNSKMRELAGCDPEAKILESRLFCAIISYQLKEKVIDSVADEFHMEGIRFLCKHCPDLDDPHDKRIKHCTCKYSTTGFAHKDHEACEFFYKRLKKGEIDPLPDYLR